MLNFSPFRITTCLLLFFALVLGVQHFRYFLTSQSFDADTDVLAAIEEWVPLLPWIERTDFDMHLRFHKPGAIHPDVVIVDVNERSIQTLGQFPFARKTYGKFLRNLEAYGSKVAAFDITFPERERNLALESWDSLKKELEQTPGIGNKVGAILDEKLKGLDGDRIFAETLRTLKMPVIMGFAFTESHLKKTSENDISLDQKKRLKKHFIFRRQVSDNAFVHSMSDRIPVLPHAELLEALGPHSKLGFFTAEPDSDSVIRRAVGVMGYDGTAITSLAVRAVSAYLGVEPKLVGGDGLKITDKEENGLLSVPLSPSGSYLLRYYGGPSRDGFGFPYIEFSDVVSDDPAVQAEVAKKLKGKIAFVGVTAVGLKDIRANPFSKDYPGVEVHATFASNILTKTFMEKDGRYFFYGYLFLAFLGGVAGLLVYRLHPFFAFPLTIVLVVVFQFFTQDMFFNEGIVVPTILPSFASLMVLFSGVLHRYFNEEKEKKIVRTAFSRYVSGPVIEEILRDQSKLKLGGQKKELTVMFCDLVGFTKLSEKLDPAKLTNLLNEYFTRMTRIILSNGGTLDKYMGDAIMCFWGAPLDVPDHGKLACKTALEMTAELRRINQEWKEKYDLTIGLRIGINTGEMNVGNMGSEQVFSYTVMGDNVNLGSRLEGINNFYGTIIMASQFTVSKAGEDFVFRSIDRVQVKGKEEAVEIFELVSEAGDSALSREWIYSFEKGLSAYREGKWDEAKGSFGTCLALRPEDPPSKVFLERIGELEKQSPQDWDGVWKMNSK